MIVARLPSAKTAISVINSVLRGTRAVSAAIRGAPITTPRAYAEIMWPAVGSLMCRLVAISGSRPMATNSLVPMPKPPSASANTASFSAAGCGATMASGFGPAERTAVVVKGVCFRYFRSAPASLQNTRSRPRLARL